MRTHRQDAQDPVYDWRGKFAVEFTRGIHARISTSEDSDEIAYCHRLWWVEVDSRYRGRSNRGCLRTAMAYP